MIVKGKAASNGHGGVKAPKAPKGKSSAARNMQSWTPAELARIQQLMDEGKTVFDIAQDVQRTPYAVVGKLVAAGRLVQDGKFDYFEIDTVPWALGSQLQDDYQFVQKKGPRPARNMLNWDAHELDRVTAMMDEGKTIFEIAEAVERTPYAVLSRLPGLARMGDMNYYRIKRKPWALAAELKAHRDKEMSLQA